MLPVAALLGISMLLSAAAKEVAASGLKEASSSLLNSLSYERIQSLDKTEFGKSVERALNDYRIRIRIYYGFEESDAAAAKFLQDVVDDARRYITSYYDYIKESEESTTRAADFKEVVGNAADDVRNRVRFYTEDTDQLMEDPLRRGGYIDYEDDDYYDDSYGWFNRNNYWRRLAPGY